MIAGGNNWYENVTQIFDFSVKNSDWTHFDKIINLAETDSVFLALQKQFLKNNHYTMEVIITNRDKLRKVS